MKRRITLILLFILVFTGVALLGHPQVWAYNVLNRTCDDSDDDDGAELADKVCAEHRDPDTNERIFVTQIYVDESIASPTIGLADDDDWPIKNENEAGDVTSLTWQYSIIAHAGVEDCRGIPGGNFVYWELLGPLPTILSSDPPGASLLKDQVKNCNLFTGPAIERLKLNAEFQCKVDKKTGEFMRVVFSATTEVTGIDDRCANFALVNRDGCLAASLLGPQGGAGVSYSAGHTVYCGENMINVTLNECNGLITGVTMSGAQWVCHATVGDPDHAWLHVYENEGDEDPRHSFPSTDAGPRATGFGVCLEPPKYTDATGDNKPEDLIPEVGFYAYPTDVFLQGDNSWYGVIGNQAPYPDRCIERLP